MTTPLRHPRFVLVALTLASITVLSGCAPLLVGGTAATTAIVATDRRTTGEQVEDQAIELKTAAEMRRLFEDTARVNVTSYAGRVLLTGDVPTQQAKQQATEATQKVEKVKRVINELRVGEKTAISVRTNDTWLTSKVKTALINTKEVPTRTIVVTTERGVVYLLGKLTREEADRAAKVASSVSGVNKVVKAFEIVAAETLVTDPPQHGGAAASPNSASQDSSTSAAGMSDSDNGVQAMPVQ